MQFSDSSPQFSVQKFGFIVMAPIALVLHGLFLLIPLAPEQKAKEPEKKEELQPVGSIAQLPLTTISASPTPQASSSPAPIAQAQQQPTPMPSIQTPQSPSQQAPSPNTPQTQQSQKPSTTPDKPTVVSPPNPVDKPMATSGDFLANGLNAKVCAQSTTTCHTTPMAQVDVLAKLGKQFETNSIEIKDENENVIGYEIKNKELKQEYIYFTFAQSTNASGQAITITTIHTLPKKITDRKELSRLGINM